MVSGIVIRVPDSGLPVWQEALLTVLGCGIAFGLLYGLHALTLVPQARRIRRRVAAVEAAAGDGPVFGVDAVHAAATSLFREMHAAWDAADRRRLERISAPDLTAGWSATLDANAAAGVRYRVEVLKGPRVDYVGVMDVPGEDADWVCVRVRARLHSFLELPDGSRRALPDAKGARKTWIEEYWTLSRRDGGWIIWSTRSAGAGRELLTEEIAGPAR